MEKCRFYRNDICAKNHAPCYDEYGDDCMDFDPAPEIPDISSDDIEFTLTCGACPEQYDATVKGMINVAYLRLRWGYFSVTCPDFGGEEVYSASIGDSWAGIFQSDKQRGFHLKAAKRAIAKYVNSHKDILTL